MSHQSPLIEKDIHAYLKQHEQKDLLRFITCGSVDDGKSTLIGRLLHDSQLIYEDQLAAITKDSSKYGTTDEGPDLALLVDGLQSEREQGITIDVAYRYFSTDKRKFIIADTPGHAQYTRNMATGASHSQAAVLLVDASKGILEQTRRHASIVTLLGIRSLILAINKMDLVNFDQAVFKQVEEEFMQVIGKLGVTDAHVVAIPISALNGDQVVHRSDRLSWFNGPTLMEALERLSTESTPAKEEFRFPVQYVSRPNAQFRGYSGTVASGQVSVGDRILVLPSRRTSQISRIVTFDGDVTVAKDGEAITVVLADDLDVARGDMLVHPEGAPSVVDALDAHVVWMHDDPLKPGKLYDIKFGTKILPATADNVLSKQDVGSLETIPADDLSLNEIGLTQWSLSAKIPIDTYAQLPGTGRFVVVDRVTNATMGAGMVVSTARSDIAQQESNVTRHQTSVTREVRAGQKGQKARVFWFTGLSGAGKSTLANAFDRKLVSLGHHTFLLDGDNVRHGLNRDLGFDDASRVENIRRIGEVAKLMTDAGLIVLTAFISPFRQDRYMVRELFNANEFVEVFVDTPLSVAEARDPKGLYAKARSGEISDFTGLDSPYERPTEPEIYLDGTESIDTLVEQMAVWLQKQE